MNDELKKCPFCVSEAKLWEIKLFNKMYTVSCTDDECPAYQFASIDPLYGSQPNQLYETKEKAIKKWNTRNG